MRTRALPLPVPLLLIIGCGQDVLPPAPPPPPPAPALAIASGNGQEGMLGEFLAEPLAVRVTDPNGDGVAGVTVTWTINAGAGEFGVSTGVTPTSANGLASISFRPLATSGPTGMSVTAWAEGVDHSPVHFTLHVLAPDVPAEVLIPFGPVFDCTGGNDPSTFPTLLGTIPVGALVVWEYADWLDPSCLARVRSVSAPSGGTPFDLLVYAGQRYGVILDVAGDWVVRDVINGGALTLQVR